jgi:hypothetical protein
MNGIRGVVQEYNKEIVMYPSVVSVRPLNDYKLLPVFETSEKRIFDVAPYLNTGKFAELRNPSVFHSVMVKFDTIEWSNQLDIDPEFLYEKSVKAEA